MSEKKYIFELTEEEFINLDLDSDDGYDKYYLFNYLKGDSLDSEKIKEDYIINNDIPCNILNFENPSESLKLLAVKNNPESIKYIKQQSEELQLFALERLKNYICFDSFENDYYFHEWFKNPCDKVQEYFAKHYFFEKHTDYRNPNIGAYMAEKFFSPKYFEMYLKYKDCRDLIK